MANERRFVPRPFRRLLVVAYTAVGATAGALAFGLRGPLGQVVGFSVLCLIGRQAWSLRRGPSLVVGDAELRIYHARGVSIYPLQAVSRASVARIKFAWVFPGPRVPVVHDWSGGVHPLGGIVTLRNPSVADAAADEINMRVESLSQPPG